MRREALCVHQDGLDRNPLCPAEWNDEHWDAFLPDVEQLDPQPEPGDFWVELDRSALDEDA